jgi:hypothetical protein
MTTIPDDDLQRIVTRRRRARDLHTRIRNLELHDSLPDEHFCLPPVATFHWQRGPINPPREMRERAMAELWGGVWSRAVRLASDAVDDAVRPDANIIDRVVAEELIAILQRVAFRLETV